MVASVSHARRQLSVQKTGNGPLLNPWRGNQRPPLPDSDGGAVQSIVSPLSDPIRRSKATLVCDDRRPRFLSRPCHVRSRLHPAIIRFCSSPEYTILASCDCNARLIAYSKAGNSLRWLMPQYRYVTPALHGRWFSTPTEALRDALRAGQASAGVDACVELLEFTQLQENDDLDSPSEPSAGLRNLFLSVMSRS